MPKLTRKVVPFTGTPSALPDTPLAYVDTETSGLYADDGARVAVVSAAWWEDGTLRSAAWPFDQGTVGKPEGTDQIGLWGDDINLGRKQWDLLLGWLAGRKLVFHNAKFDLEKLRVGTRLWPGVDLEDQVEWDTMLACKELWPLESGALKVTAKRLWGETVADESVALKKHLKKRKLPAGRWDLADWEVIGPYAAKDAELTARLHIHQMGLADSAVVAWMERELAVMRVLYREERRGLPYNPAESIRVADQLGKVRREVGKKLPFEPTGPKAKQYYFGKGETSRGVACLELLPYEVSPKTNEPSLTDAIVARMVRDKVPFADTWRDWNKVDTAISMWYRAYAEMTGQDGRLRTCFRQTTVTSGRFSVERVNLQAMPHDYRLSALFKLLEGVPSIRQIIGSAVPPGWTLWELDLAQAELRTAARWANCTPMLEAFNDTSRDLHGETATNLFQKDASAPDWSKVRQVGKRGNFTLCFGAGPKTFQAMLAKEMDLYLSDDEATRIVRGWNALYPQFKRAIYNHADLCERKGYVPLVNGRRRWFQKYEETHKAFNQRVQASIAELGKDLLLEADRQLIEYGIPQQGIDCGIGEAGLLLTIHDSLVMLLPDDYDWWVDDFCDWGSKYASTMFDVPMVLEAKRWGK